MINHGEIIIKDYHKPSNLFLYIPDFSAHPPGLQKSVIYGLPETYWHQNTKKEDFLSMIRFLFRNLIARGCKPDKMSMIFISAAENIEKKLVLRRENTLDVPKKKNKEERLFFHIQYHPRDVSRQQIRDWYENTCETPDDNGESLKSLTTKNGENLKIDRLTIAYHRSKNLRDYLCPSKLRECTTSNVQKTIDDRTR